MKNTIKSNKGVTITGLVIYISSFLMICMVIGIITTFFYNNTKVLSSEATASAEYDILNAYLAKDVKNEEGSLSGSTDKKTIKFTNGNEYIFLSGKIYLCNTETNKYFIVANYIEDASFEIIENKLQITIKILGKSYEQEYNLTN